MKPSWDDAPEWAQWLAKDKDGTWYWYEYQPIVAHGQWYMTEDGRWEAVITDSWNDSLEPRP